MAAGFVSMWLNGVYLAVSFIALFIGAELLVKGASQLALRLGLTPMAIGLTVVALGTSMPELVVSLQASLVGAGDIAMGNVVGSNIFNLGVILGLTALIRPLAVQSSVIRTDAPLMMLATVVLVILLLVFGGISRGIGLLLTIAMIAYIWWNLREAGRQPDAALDAAVLAEPKPKSQSAWIHVGLIIIGLLVLTGGSRLLVVSATDIARGFGISEAIIGLTIVAAGTSMPELATSSLATIRRETDIAIGNLIGSNIFNILGILGIVGLIAPIQAPGITQMDVWVMFAFAFLCFPLLWTGRMLQRWEGAVLLVGYILYLAVLWP